MGIFDDKKFEELDWVSQAIEPIESKLSEFLAAIPDETTIDYNMYIKLINDRWDIGLSLHTVINHLMIEHCKILFYNLYWQHQDELIKCFSFSSDEDLIIDFKNQTLVGTLRVIKTTSTLDEKVLENLLGRLGAMRVVDICITTFSNGRANEVMEILGGCDHGIKTRSPRQKQLAIRDRLVKLFKDNEWKIKDTTLADNVGIWISLYIKEGNLAAWSNFCKLKVMTHKNQPIYSMEEIK